ncbi:MAG TPA: DUF1508 domain-containing protein [Clostridiales bacterium]|nr:DUF1508 domain-containing protein [Clostridiales bacterium]
MQLNLLLNIFLATTQTYLLLGVVILVIIAIVSIIATISKKKARKKSQAKDEVKYEEKQDNTFIEPIFSKDDESSNVDFDSSHQDVMRLSSAQTSIMLKPIKSRPRPPKKARAKEIKEEIVELKESSFNKDHIYDEELFKKPGIISMYLDVDGLYRFKIITSANETIAISKAHINRFSCIKAIKLAIVAGKYAEVVDSTDAEYMQMLRMYMFEISRDLENKFRFKLKTRTLQDILVSPGYVSKFNCINGVKSVRNVLEFHTLRDDTSKTFVANFEEEVRAVWQEYISDDSDSEAANEDVKASIGY